MTSFAFARTYWKMDLALREKRSSRISYVLFNDDQLLEVTSVAPFLTKSFMNLLQESIS
jgi:hypothetical protein